MMEKSGYSLFSFNVLIVITMMMLWTGLNAQENEGARKNGYSSLESKALKCKTKIKDGMTSMAYIRVKPEMVLKQTPYKNSISFIRNIKAKVSNIDVLNISFGNPLLFKQSGVRFNFEDFAPDAQNIEFEITDNRDEKVKKSCEIFRENTVSKKTLVSKYTDVLSHSIDKKVWAATSIKEVAELLYGVDATKQLENPEVAKNIQLMCPDKYSHTVPKSLWYEKQCFESLNFSTAIKIHSTKDLESAALLYTGNEFPLVFFATFSNYSHLPLKVATSFYKEGRLMLLAKDKNGTLYYSKSYFLNTSTASGLDDGTYLEFYIK